MFSVAASVLNCPHSREVGHLYFSGVDLPLSVCFSHLVSDGPVSAPRNRDNNQNTDGHKNIHSHPPLILRSLDQLSIKYASEKGYNSVLWTKKRHVTIFAVLHFIRFTLLSGDLSVDVTFTNCSRWLLDQHRATDMKNSSRDSFKWIKWPISCIMNCNLWYDGVVVNPWTSVRFTTTNWDLQDTI